MSAFIVGEEHIRYLVNAGLSRSICPHGISWRGGGSLQRGEQDTAERANRTGAMLWEENYRSVNYRYRESDAAPSYQHRAADLYDRFDPVQVLKAIACFEYQSCEHSGWKGSEAAAFCEELRLAAIARLPGYDAAAWEVTR